MRRIHLLAVLGVALVAALALTLVNLGPTVAQAAPPDKGPWPYQEFGSCNPAGYTHCGVQLAPIQTGKRLIIQHVSVEAMVPTGVQPRMTLFARLNGADVLYFLPAQKVASSGIQDHLRGTHQVLAFADSTGRSTIYLSLFQTALESPATVLFVTVSGYLEAL